jgi:hypothetical protein
MKITSLKIQWVRYVPEWKGCRTCAPEEQPSLELRRLRPIDDLGEENIRKWRDETLVRYADDRETQNRIQGANDQVLTVFKRIAQNSKNWKNWEFEQADGSWKEEHDPLKILLYLPNPIGQDQKDSLLVELLTALSELANCTDDELKNFASRCGGTILESPAPRVAMDASPPSAVTPSATDGSAS